MRGGLVQLVIQEGSPYREDRSQGGDVPEAVTESGNGGSGARGRHEGNGR